MTAPPCLLTPALVAMIRKGVSTIAASVAPDGTPSLMRAVGADISDDGTRVQVFLARSQSAQLLHDIETTGAVAVVFSEPLSHRTVQVKARRTTLRPARPDDTPLLARYLASMQVEVGAVGYPPHYVAAMLSHRLDDVVVVSFTPESAFDQTPGPRAGAPLGGGAGAAPAGGAPAGGAARPAVPAAEAAVPPPPAPLDEAVEPATSGPSVAGLRACFEGAIPAMIATSAADGTPNVAYLSQVVYVDPRHVALSFQFFSKTRENVLARPIAMVLVMDPRTAEFHRLLLRYLRTESSGAVFERMRAQLAGIASHSGMSGVFRLLGSDIYRVEAAEQVCEARLTPAPPPSPGLLAALREGSQRLADCSAMDALLQTLLDVLDRGFGVHHAMVLALDAAAGRLYTVASRGYEASGVGSEIALGQGVIGVAARERTPIRIGHMINVASYGHAARASLRNDAPGLPLDTEIPYPGLAAPRSQMALPIVCGGRLLGVLFVESTRELAFGVDEEDAITALAAHLGTAMDALSLAGDDAAPAADQAPRRRRAGAAAAAQGVATGTEADRAGADGEAGARCPAACAPPLLLRRYRVNDSVFVDGRYLIKGVAGAILWKLLREHLADGRVDFSNRELRLDRSLRLPDVTDNLETRLLLLQRRLQEQCPAIRLERTGRGQLRLRLERPLRLEDDAG